MNLKGLAGCWWRTIGKERRGETGTNPDFGSGKRTYYILNGHFQGNGHFVPHKNVLHE